MEVQVGSGTVYEWATNLTYTSNGVFVACLHETGNNQAVIYTSADDGATWTEHARVQCDATNGNDDTANPALALDSTDTVGLLHNNGSSQRFSSWSVGSDGALSAVVTDETVSGSLFDTSYGNCALAVDSTDEFYCVHHVSGSIETSSYFTLRQRAGGSWDEIGQVDALSDESYMNLAVDSADTLHFVYEATGQSEVRYQSYSGSFSGVEVVKAVTEKPNLVLKADEPFVVLKNNEYQLQRDGGTWTQYDGWTTNSAIEQVQAVADNGDFVITFEDGTDIATSYAIGTPTDGYTTESLTSTHNRALSGRWSGHNHYTASSGRVEVIGSTTSTAYFLTVQNATTVTDAAGVTTATGTPRTVGGLVSATDGGSTTASPNPATATEHTSSGSGGVTATAAQPTTADGTSAAVTAASAATAVAGPATTVETTEATSTGTIMATASPMTADPTTATADRLTAADAVQAVAQPATATVTGISVSDGEAMTATAVPTTAVGTNLVSSDGGIVTAVGVPTTVDGYAVTHESAGPTNASATPLTALVAGLTIRDLAGVTTADATPGEATNRVATSITPGELNDADPSDPNGQADVNSPRKVVWLFSDQPGDAHPIADKNDTDILNGTSDP